MGHSFSPANSEWPHCFASMHTSCYHSFMQDRVNVVQTVTLSQTILLNQFWGIPPFEECLHIKPQSFASYKLLSKCLRSNILELNHPNLLTWLEIIEDIALSSDGDLPSSGRNKLTFGTPSLSCQERRGQPNCSLPRNKSRNPLESEKPIVKSVIYYT